MAKVLVTGGAGFIGSHLCDRLIAQGDEVIVLDDFSSGFQENIKHLDARIQVVKDSILNIPKFQEVFHGVTRIYHLAALISGYDSLKEPESYINVNLVGLVRLINLARELGGVRIIFASSSTVYGNNPNCVCSEDDQVAPLTMYALSKFAGEHMLSMYSKLYGIDYVCLRLFNVYGPRQNPSHPYANVTCKFSAAAAVGEGIRLYGDGEQSRDFVYIDDVVDALLLVSAQSQHKIYNVGTGISSSIKSLIGEIERASDRKIDVEQMPPWPNDIQVIRADVSRLAEEFGYRPNIPLNLGLTKTVAYFQQQAKFSSLMVDQRQTAEERA